MIRGTTNVYNRATWWRTFTTLVLLGGVLVLDIWLMDKLPILRHGVGYAMLQVVMVGELLGSVNQANCYERTRQEGG